MRSSQPKTQALGGSKLAWKVGKKGVGTVLVRNVTEGIQLSENSLVSWNQILLDQILTCCLFSPFDSDEIRNPPESQFLLGITGIMHSPTKLKLRSKIKHLKAPGTQWVSNKLNLLIKERLALDILRSFYDRV